MPKPPPAVFINFIYQPLNVVFTVAGDTGGCPQCSTDKFIADNQHPEIKPCNISFTYHVPAVVSRRFQRLFGLFCCCYIGCCAFTMVAINGFYYKWKPYFPDGILYRIVPVNNDSRWHRDLRGTE